MFSPFLLLSFYKQRSVSFCRIGGLSHRRQLNGFMALGRSPRPVFFFFFRGEAAKKEEKGYFWGIASPKPPLCKAASR
jgi:hypothetical protein